MVVASNANSKFTVEHRDNVSRWMSLSSLFRLPVVSLSVLLCGATHYVLGRLAGSKSTILWWILSGAVLESV